MKERKGTSEGCKRVWNGQGKGGEWKEDEKGEMELGPTKG